MEKLICISCPMGCHLEVDVENDYSVTGNQCNRGIIYARKELTNPTRIVTSTVVIKGGIYHRLPVKTNDEVSKKLVLAVMEEINKVEVTSPIKCGDVIIKNVLDTNVDVVASRSM